MPLFYFIGRHYLRYILYGQALTRVDAYLYTTDRRLRDDNIRDTGVERGPSNAERANFASRYTVGQSGGMARALCPESTFERPG